MKKDEIKDIELKFAALFDGLPIIVEHVTFSKDELIEKLKELQPLGGHDSDSLGWIPKSSK